LSKTEEAFQTVAMTVKSLNSCNYQRNNSFSLWMVKDMFKQSNQQ